MDNIMTIDPMRRALELAEQAARKNEVPVGAVITHKGQIIAEAHNTKEADLQAIRHAEMIAIENASKALGAWRLNECSLYVTLEPCLMCAGAIIQARLGKVFFATKDPKGGAITSLYNFFDDERLNHQPSWDCGQYQEEASQLLKDFFSKKRNRQKRLK